VATAQHLSPGVVIHITAALTAVIRIGGDVVSKLVVGHRAIVSPPRVCRQSCRGNRAVGGHYCLARNV